MNASIGWSGDHVDMTVPWPTTSDVRVFDLAVRLEPGMPKHPYHPPYSFVLAEKHGHGLYPGGISWVMEMIAMGPTGALTSTRSATSASTA